MTAPQPAAHTDCTLSPHCPDCGWLRCAEHQVLISRRPGVTLGAEIADRKGAPHD